MRVPVVLLPNAESLSSWRAWIEIGGSGGGGGARRSLSSWRAWIEISPTPAASSSTQASLSSWRAWIEISRARMGQRLRTVALLMESVD